jgi:hypothetical protein
VALAAYLWAAFRPSLGVPFRADDFLFLGRTARADFLSLFGVRDLIFNYYRPWSRELQYWLVQRAFGPVEPPFHVIAWLLWLAALVLFWALARRIAGATAATIATAGVAALAAWGTLLMWIPGNQDLWMLALSLACLLAVAHGRMILATAFLVLALLSKETALVLPGVVIAQLVILERRSLRETLARAWPLVAVTIAWAALHPLLGGRLVHPVHSPTASWSHPAPGLIGGRLLLTLVNLDELPRPEAGFAPVALPALLAAIPLVGLAVWAAWRRDAGATGASPGRVAAFGATWALLGWLPLLEPSLPWHPYYGLLGAFGAWLILGTLLERRAWIAPIVIAALVALHAGRVATPSVSLDSEWYLARVGDLVRSTRAYFTAAYPSFPGHSRVFLAEVPGNLGLVPADTASSVLAVWYRDPTLSANYLSRYRPRAPAEPPGPDWFFTFDPARGWSEEEHIPAGPRAERDQWDKYARTMWSFHEFPEAIEALERLARAEPGNVDHAVHLGDCHLALGDTTQAIRWYRRAAALPGAPAEIAGRASALERGARAPDSLAAGHRTR